VTNTFSFWSTYSYSHIKISYWCTMSTRPLQSHSGAQGNILAGPQNNFTGPLWEKIFEFFFSKWYILAYFWLTTGLPKRRRAQGSLLPLPHPLDGPDVDQSKNSLANCCGSTAALIFRRPSSSWHYVALTTTCSSNTIVCKYDIKSKRSANPQKRHAGPHKHVTLHYAVVRW